ncbi:hypothetical protein GR925_37430 [Streptomyces sp. HUCO-GS316]|uniref:DUF6247 family protein n=1 Tax=Streptomyces sp. HUCO-GS316 TaxID=2692198 RepID=UPI00136FE60B|nr:DUF6247 family protein [Streptomyces sp. HUCO-GS316]MXM68930.1 hypothetical protein [Streptomyces sp. HUCO-GS316]
MTEQAAEPTGPRIPMPEKNPAALRVAVGRLDPGALAQFDQQWDEAMRQARDEYTLTPPRAFVEHWWSWVGVARYPQRLARFRECERIVSESDDRAERRAAATELASILAEAVAA